MIQEAYYYWGLSAIVYIATCYIFSAVRWFHTCDKPKESHEYIWPDRKAQAIVYLLSSILIPYIFNPKDENAWLLWKCYFPVTYYFYCGMLLFCFFGSVKQWNQWKGVTWLAGAIVALTMTPLIINAWIPGSILQPDKWGGQFYLWIAAAISILMMCYCAVAMWQVWKWMHQASPRGYDNSGSLYLLNGMTVADGWGNEFYYYSEVPYQSYRLWSAGPNYRTFPPWLDLSKFNQKEQETIANWTKDDISHLAN